MGSKAHQRRRARRRPGIAGSAVRRARADKTSCTRGEAPIARLAGATTSKWPCTMSPAAQRQGCRAMRCLSRAGQCGRRRGKKDSTRMQADARKTREWARARHGRSRLRLAAPQPGEPRQCGSPCPIRVFCVHLPASALRLSCFDARRTLLRRTPDRARKPGYHAPIRPPAAAGSSSRPEADIIACCQNPMHQFAPALRQDNSQGRETPHAQRAVARSVLLTVSPRSAHETMARLARDRSVRYFV